MSGRAAKFVSAVFVSLLAGGALTALSNNAARAADECLAGPRDKTPQGGHWYFRIDASKRHCWYLKAENENLAKPVMPAAPNAEPAMQPSIADAHAEWLVPRAGFDPETNLAAGQNPLATTANGASQNTNRDANAPDANTKLSLVASRWPDQSDAGSSAGRESVADSVAANAPPHSDAAPPAAIAAAPLATADASPEKPGEVQMLLIVIIGALALAGLLGSVIFRFGGTRWSGRSKKRVDRRAIWESIDADSGPRPVYIRARTGDLSRDPQYVGDRDDRIREFFSHMSGRSPT